MFTHLTRRFRLRIRHNVLSHTLVTELQGVESDENDISKFAGLNHLQW